MKQWILAIVLWCSIVLYNTNVVGEIREIDNGKIFLSMVKELHDDNLCKDHSQCKESRDKEINGK